MSVLISTGDIRASYEIIDAIFAPGSNAAKLFSSADPYRNALSEGFMGKKQAIEIFGYGTAVKRV